MVLKRIFNFLKQWSRKRQIRGKCNGSITAAVWRRLTAQLAETGLMTADVLAVQRCWLDERPEVVSCRQVKAAVVCLSVGRS